MKQPSLKIYSVDSHPVRVIAFNTVKAGRGDVTEDVAQAVLNKA